MWVEVAVVATEVLTSEGPSSPACWANALGAALLSASVALPGVLTSAYAETAPERAMVSFKSLDYLDYQPGADRIRVRAPSLSSVVPLNAEWSVAGTLITDSISGASPAYHSSGLTPMHDFRRAVDASLTHYLPRGSVTLGLSHSRESDYLSRGLSVQGTRSSEDKNTLWNLGVALNRDTINPTNRVVENEHKQGVDLLAGLTQVLGVHDIAQFNLGYSRGQGYFSDPYKVLDNRPRERQRVTLNTRWNHHFEDLQGTARFSYRYYRDDWAIRAHTLESEYVHPLGERWRLAPSLRLYTQTAARFFVQPSGGPGGGDGLLMGFGDAQAYTSGDQRLSAFGAMTVGMKLIYQPSPDTVWDIKMERYEQRGGWTLFGPGTSGLAPFGARTLQFGVTHWF